MAGLTKYEMETVVNYNAGEQSATVGVNSAMSSSVKPLLKIFSIIFSGDCSPTIKLSWAGCSENKGGQNQF